MKTLLLLKHVCWWGRNSSMRSCWTVEGCGLLCDPAQQQQRPYRCSLIHSREQLVYKSTASLCLWCRYAEIRFFIVQRGLLLPSGFVSHHRKTSKGDAAFWWIFRGCLLEETSLISWVRVTPEVPLPLYFFLGFFQIALVWFPLCRITVGTREYKL